MACAMRACRSWAPAPMPSTWPKTASASRHCWNELKLKQPRNATAMTAEETVKAARKIGYPVILRPSYVLGGRGMVVVSDEPQLKEQVESGELFRISGDNPVLIDGFLHHATEVDVDAICDGDGDVFIAGIMEHIEEAGVHSGDSACSLPPHSLSRRDHRRNRAPDHRHGARAEGPRTDECAIRHPGGRDLCAGGQSARQPHRALRRQGHRPAGGGDRRARDGGRDTEILRSQETSIRNTSRSRKRCCPSAAFPAWIRSWARRCAPPAKSWAWTSNFGRAFAKSQIGAGTKLPTGGTVFISVKDADKDLIEAPRANWSPWAFP